MKLLGSSFLLLLAVMLTAMVPGSPNPEGSPEAKRTSTRLLGGGSWKVAKNANAKIGSCENKT
ncbi:C-X-C motif chemokine 17 [Apodemus speciosus]|uniref:C-X-C motif chemokine 17 n=1 Tax=Apodemus speciosus TaxID=105296 RepID=A0ABQ0EXH0_APOSI